MNISFTQIDIDYAAQKAWEQLSEYKIWAFNAPMGAGKTTFIHALCEYLKVKDQVSSPTFAIINEYQSEVAGAIYHMDWYRLKNEEEAIQAGVEDCLLSGNICFIEWPNKAPGILPSSVLQLTIEIIDDTTRRLSAADLPKMK
ncbi:MAG: tRNA (adenosine(37)-N6)-threonylcarbamoyltransferase complex ATPase subunit type 1 TsaE [Ilyomonas sp.]